MAIVSDCLSRKLQIVGICALMVLSILNLCFQFAAIWLNGFFTEQWCKQAYVIIAILHISVLPFVWNCSSSGEFFSPFLWVGLVKSFITDNQSLLKQLEKSWICLWVIYSNLEIQSAFLMPEGCQTADRCWQDIADSIYLQLSGHTWNPTAKLTAYSMVVVAAKLLAGLAKFWKQQNVLPNVIFILFFSQTPVSVALNDPLM